MLEIQQKGSEVFWIRPTAAGGGCGVELTVRMELWRVFSPRRRAADIEDRKQFSGDS